MVVGSLPYTYGTQYIWVLNNCLIRNVLTSQESLCFQSSKDLELSKLPALLHSIQHSSNLTINTQLISS